MTTPQKNQVLIENALALVRTRPGLAPEVSETILELVDALPLSQANVAKERLAEAWYEGKNSFMTGRIYLSELRQMMESKGYTQKELAGFESFERGDREVRFFWWSNRKHAEKLNVPWSSLVVRLGVESTHIPLVEWPSEEIDPPLRPWVDVAKEVFTFLKETP